MDNLYTEAGIVLELIQKWENEFKLLTEYFKIEKSDDKRSLSNMNNFLYRNHYVDNNEYLLIKRIIQFRNYVIHKLFMENIQTAKINILSITKDIKESLEMFKSKY